MNKLPILGILVALALSQSCFRMRWPDDKAYASFERQGVPLKIIDTLIEGHSIHFAVSSRNDSLPTLIFIHGSPGSWFHYRKFMLDAELGKKFRIVSIDRPGFGHSDFGKALHLEEQARIIAPILESLKLAKPMFLCGHSMGGPVVVKLAADNPEMFKTIIIVAGAIDAAQEKKERWRHLMGKPAFRWMLPGAFRPSNMELLFLKKDLIPLQADFKNIHCNVRFVHGDKDTWVPIENVAFGEKMMINAQSLNSDTLHGADHQIPWKRFQSLKDILMALE
ncbi:MAG: alpha/beta hydrolase [Saprospiraceae bacterium]|nr:alpha/beta hydrolase [Saprospiraceae bacterium]